MWIYQHDNWTSFSWDFEAIGHRCSHVRHRQGRLLGRVENLGFELRSEASLSILTSDVVKSSAIEGEALDSDEVRSSIARRLGIDLAGLPSASRAVEGTVEMMLDATQQFSSPLTDERLFAWHAALFPTGRSGMRPITVAHWRPAEAGPMQVISGPFGKERIHFEAPAAEVLPSGMRDFLTWFEEATPMDPVIKAGIAHFWFVTLHPFEDGNGRIARAIGDMALARSDQSAHRFYSLSTQIEADRKAYYAVLEKQQRGTPDLTLWLSWFLDCLDRAITQADMILDRVFYKSRLWDRLNQHPVNERQRLIINRMLEMGFEGGMNTSKYAKIAKCSSDTALRDIQALKKWGVLCQNPGGGRSTSYRLSD